MRTFKLFSIVTIVAIVLQSCTSAISLTKGQEATMSKEAVETLKTFKVFRLPMINPSDKMIFKIRDQFAQMEAQQLEINKKRYEPLIEETVINGVKVYIITPSTLKPENKDKVAIYIHGGGYVMGSATDQTGIVMANDLGLKTYSIDYTLSPEAKFPVALNQSLEVYKHIVTKYNPKNVIGFSTSSGSGHMMGMLLKAKQENLPMINSVALLSPSLDLTGNGDSYVSNDGRDLLAYKNQADKLYAKPFLGEANPYDPLVSPIYGTYDAAFPATVITTSTRDLFLSNSARMYWKLRDVNVSAELLVSEGMFHALTVYPDIPEAIQTRKAVKDFLFQSLNNGKYSENMNKEIVTQFIQKVVNEGKIDEVPNLWTTDMKWHGGSMGEIEGIDNYMKSLRASVGSAFVDMHLDIKDIITSVDKVVLRFTNSGNNMGAFMGNKPTNKNALWEGIGVYRIKDGKIAEAWFSEDILGMYSQLGLIDLSK